MCVDVNGAKIHVFEHNTICLLGSKLVSHIDIITKLPQDRQHTTTFLTQLIFDMFVEHLSSSKDDDNKDKLLLIFFLL